jgi:Icc-related predicted phosphoesterase
MKLLLFSDVHVNKAWCEQLVKMSEEADIVVGAGDYGALRTGLEVTIKWLSPIDKPAILVPGNAESYDELVKACEVWPSAIVLHGNGVEVHGYHFFGIGGGIPITPFGDWSWDFSEAQAEDLLKDCPDNAILVSHSPPKGILDLSSMGQQLGSTSLRDFIEKMTLKLVICGHIHESGGKTDNLNQTVVINAGPYGVFFKL